MTMTDERPDSLRIPLYLRDAVMGLVLNSALREKLAITDFANGNEGFALIPNPEDVPPEVWSSGEKALWRAVQAACTLGTLNIGDLAWVVGTPAAPHLLEICRCLLLLDPPLDPPRVRPITVEEPTSLEEVERQLQQVNRLMQGALSGLQKVSL